MRNEAALQRRYLMDRADEYLRELCLNIPDRSTGSPGNRVATSYAAEKFSQFGFQVEKQWFDCLDWKEGDVVLRAGDERLQAQISPYSLGCRVNAPLVVIGSIQELVAADLADKIALLQGEIATSQLFPKNFPFVSFEEHQQIIALLEDKKPAAIIAATSRNPELAGGLYPFPMFEDGDFDLPSVYITDEDGLRLAAQANELVSLSIEAARIPSKGCNVIARKGSSNQRIAVWAHIDAKRGTPGALDNAAGVVTLFLLAELLSAYDLSPGIEITAINGEDYYSAAGQQKYLELYGRSLDQLLLGINIDGAGYKEGPTAYSLYGCPDGLAELVRNSFPTDRGFLEGEPWYQSDHAIFVLNERPALAITTGEFTDVWSRIAHTPEDRPELVDAGKLVDIVWSINTLTRAVARSGIS